VSVTEAKNDIPDNWVRTSLGAVCTAPQYGYTTKAADKGDLHLLRTTDITSGRIDWDKVPFCSDDPDDPAKYLLEDGDIVVSRAGSVGVSHLVSSPRRAVFASYLIRFKPHIDRRFFKYFLEGPAYWTSIADKKLGIAVPNVNATKLKSITLPLPPIEEQRRIVAKIEELFSELDKGVESLQAARAQLEVYRLLLLEGAVSGRLLVENGTRTTLFEQDHVTSLKEVVEDLGQGWSPRCLSHPSASEDVWGVIKTTAIQHMSFDGTQNKELPEHLEARPHLEIGKGDVLVTRAGPRTRVGVACMVRSCRPRLILCDKAYRLRPKADRVLPEYLELILNAPSTLSDVERLKTGINDSGVNLTQGRFLSLELLIPGIPDQARTVSELSARLTRLEHAKRQVEDALSREGALRQSILQVAFSGRLVPQDQSDEPASVLLDRIRTERENETNSNKKRKAAS
jgi:type I restriction enzyme, S subunit